MGPLRWGICGTGKQCNDFVTSLKILPESDHKIHAIAASNLDKAKKFAEEHGIPNYYGSYDELIKSNEIDIVHVGLVNCMHKPVTLNALKHGKHVLCELPMAVTAAEAREMVQTAREKKLFLMEAFWTRYFPAFKFVRDQINSGAIGEPSVVVATAGLDIHSMSPTYLHKNMGSGTLLYFGYFSTQLASFLFGPNPTKIHAVGHLNKYGTDANATITFLYPGNKIFTFVQSDTVELDNSAVITGTKGKIEILQQWCPIEVKVNGQSQKFPLPKQVPNAKYVYWNAEGLSYEAEAIRQCILAGKTESEVMPLDESIRLAEINDEILRQLGVKYDTHQK